MLAKNVAERLLVTASGRFYSSSAFGSPRQRHGTVFFLVFTLSPLSGSGHADAPAGAAAVFNGSV